MRCVGIVLVFVGILVTSVAATAAPRIFVTPAKGKPTTKFTVSFVVDRKLSADRWFQVSVRSPVRRRDCENEETAVISYAPTGRRVDVVLRPVDRGRWCAGLYEGLFEELRRDRCEGPGIDMGTCSIGGPVVVRFSFRVTP